MSAWIAISAYVGIALFVGRFLSLSSRGIVVYQTAARAPATAEIPAPERHEPTAPSPTREEHSRSEVEVGV
jgi:hypothetical protein